MGRTAIAVDDFESYANGVLPTSNYTNLTTGGGNGSLNIETVSTTKRLVGSGAGGLQAARRETNTAGATVSFAADQYAEITIGGLAWVGSGYRIGAAIRCSTDTDAGIDFYCVYVSGNSPGPDYPVVLSKFINGSESVLNSDDVALAVNDKLSIEGEGTTLRVCKNGVALGGDWTKSDPDLSSGKPGVVGMGNTGSGVNALDAEFGEITASPTLSDITPSSGDAGTTVPVTLTGTLMSGSNPQINVSGSGVTVQNLTVNSATEVEADFVIDGGATPGARNVTFETDDGESGAVTFTINAAASSGGAAIQHLRNLGVY